MSNYRYLIETDNDLAVAGDVKDLVSVIKIMQEQEGQFSEIRIKRVEKP